MTQITVDLDIDTATRVQRAARVEGVSQSQWVARLIRERISGEWPESVKVLEGAWSDMPDAERIRAGGGVDAEREPF